MVTKEAKARSSGITKRENMRTTMVKKIITTLSMIAATIIAMRLKLLIGGIRVHQLPLLSMIRIIISLPREQVNTRLRRINEVVFASSFPAIISRDIQIITTANSITMDDMLAAHTISVVMRLLMKNTASSNANVGISNQLLTMASTKMRDTRRIIAIITKKMPMLLRHKIAASMKKLNKY